MSQQLLQKSLRQKLTPAQIDECWLEEYDYRFQAMTGYAVHVGDHIVGRLVESACLYTPNNAFAFFDHNKMTVVVAFNK